MFTTTDFPSVNFIKVVPNKLSVLFILSYTPNILLCSEASSPITVTTPVVAPLTIAHLASHHFVQLKYLWYIQLIVVRNVIIIIIGIIVTIISKHVTFYYFDFAWLRIVYALQVH